MNIPQLDNSANTIIVELNEVIAQGLDDIHKARTAVAVRIDRALNALYAARKKNASMQRKHPVGSKCWHRHETIDDYLHEALSALGE